jgi:hypothetical protein
MVEITKIVLGKYILVIKLLEPTNELAAEETEFEKRFQGRRATKRKIE